MAAGERVKGEPDRVGFQMASKMSWRPARIKSFEDLIGIIVTLVGNHKRVSQVCRERVSQIQTLYNSDTKEGQGQCTNH